MGRLRRSSEEIVDLGLVYLQELKTLVGLTNLHTECPPMRPKLNRRRAIFVLAMGTLPRNNARKAE